MALKGVLEHIGRKSLKHLSHPVTHMTDTFTHPYNIHINHVIFVLTTTVFCSGGAFKCMSGQKCIKCDGNRNCVDNSDEIGCGKLYIHLKAAESTA